MELLVEAPIADTLLDAADRLLPWVVPGYLALVFALGGPTLDVTATDEWLQIAALPVLLLAGIPLLLDPPRAPLTRAAMLAALAIASVPLLQLLPLPSTLWGFTDARTALAADLAIAAIDAPARWSLHPEATLRGLLALLPALACFFGVVALGPHRLKRLPQVLVALVLANIAFGFLQVSLPPGSELRLHPGLGTGFGGVLVNDNHQGTALVIGLVLALGLWARARRHAEHGRAHKLRHGLWPVAVMACIVALPLSGSRAAMVIALVVAALTVAATGLLPVRQLRANRPATAGGVLALALVALGVVSAWNWMQVDALDESRQAMARETIAVGQRHAPLGSGIGSFVDVFAQDAAWTPAFQRKEYINHAHNEYAQWWMTGGVLALLVLAASLALLALAGAALLRNGRQQPVPVACWLALLAVLAHSVVDFPLRTLSLMGASATLAGLAVVLAGAALRERQHPPRALAPAQAEPQRARPAA
jgi:O-antigen ligase